MVQMQYPDEIAAIDKMEAIFIVGRTTVISVT